MEHKKSKLNKIPDRKHNNHQVQDQKLIEEAFINYISRNIHAGENTIP